MIDAGPMPPAADDHPPAPWFYPVADGRPAAPLGRLDRLRVALRLRWRLFWTRLHFRLWWLRPLHLQLVVCRMRLRLLWMALLRDARRRLHP